MLMIAERTGAALFSSKDKESIKEMDEELANVIKHFLNAVDVETLRQSKSTGKHSLSQSSARPFLRAWCRAETATQAAQTYRDRRLSPSPPLYGWHTRISAQGNHKLGGQ